ncbi:zinc-finger homeodomain protein 6-like [Argentina anserina]|uniref:zinc-finger homeodomain protein 6-like n=1 Tax=Argentina anserina TaxID=57926 RepID=UPI0021762491|nr:zinc-finger homeodomain protein 6-like [Potentilla anserina]
MEVRGQDKILGMPTTLGFSPQNRDSSSSSKLSSSSLHHHHHHHVNNTLIFNHPQTLEPFYQPPPHHEPHQSNPYKPSRDPDPVPNPDPNLSPVAVFTTPRARSTTPRGANHSFKAAPSAALAQVPVSEPVTASKAVRYRECLKNHAASTGGHVLDGCGEFMPTGGEDSPGGLRCAACECHRNFHRKEIEGETQLVHVPNNYHVLNNHNKNSHSSRRNASSAPVVPSLPPPPPVHQHYQHHHFPATSPTVPASFPPGMMTFGGGGGPAESSSEDLNHINMYDQSNQAGGSRKRFRTKFSQEQKDKMLEVAEKLGWRIQKHDEQEVQQLCSDLGVKRQVFKVWMHNNKQAMKKKQL